MCDSRDAAMGVMVFLLKLVRPGSDITGVRTFFVRKKRLT